MSLHVITLGSLNVKFHVFMSRESVKNISTMFSWDTSRAGKAKALVGLLAFGYSYLSTDANFKDGNTSVWIHVMSLISRDFMSANQPSGESDLCLRYQERGERTVTNLLCFDRLFHLLHLKFNQCNGLLEIELRIILWRSCSMSNSHCVLSEQWLTSSLTSWVVIVELFRRCSWRTYRNYRLGHFRRCARGLLNVSRCPWVSVDAQFSMKVLLLVRRHSGRTWHVDVDKSSTGRENFPSAQCMWMLSSHGTSLFR